MWFMTDTEHAGLRWKIMKDRQEPIGRRIRHEFIDDSYRSADSQRAVCDFRRLDRPNQGARQDMSRLHVEPTQPSRRLRHALRPSLSERTVRIRPIPFIPLRRDAMPKQDT